MSKDIMKEYEQLDQLSAAMKVSCRHGSESDDLESAFLANATSDEVATSNIPKDLLKNQNDLQNLVFYIFERRFGWSEQECSQENVRESKQLDMRSSIADGSPNRRLRKTSLPYAEDTRIKTMLNSKLDELINLLVICIIFYVSFTVFYQLFIAIFFSPGCLRAKDFVLITLFIASLQ